MTDKVTIGDRDVLLIVDIQNDFCPGGSLAVPRGDEVVPLINGLAGKFAHVVLTQDWHPRGHLSFASSHPGKTPYQTIEVAYGVQVLWRTYIEKYLPHIGIALQEILTLSNDERDSTVKKLDNVLHKSRTTRKPEP